MSSALTQRLAYPPNGVDYAIYQMEQRRAVLPWFGSPSYILAKYVSKRIMPHFDYVAQTMRGYVSIRDAKHADLVHKCYLDPWSIADRRWVYEFDQSVGDQLRNYFNVPHGETRTLCRLLGKFFRQRRCRAVITWTQTAAEGMVMDYDLPEDLVEVIPPPMEVTTDRIGHDGVNILHVSSEFRRKGTDIALKLHSELRRRFPDARLLVVGKAKGAPPVFWPPTPGVDIRGSVPRKVLLDEIYPSVDVLLQPSRADANPLAILEAMSFGIPVVTSRLEALVEWVPESHLGLMSDPEDMDGFLQVLSSLVEDASLRRQLGQDCQRLVRDRHQPREIGARLRAAYES